MPNKRTVQVIVSEKRPEQPCIRVMSEKAGIITGAGVKLMAPIWIHPGLKDKVVENIIKSGREVEFVLPAFMQTSAQDGVVID